MDNLKKFSIAVVTAILCWLALSFFFFPLKLTAPIDMYIYESIRHMVPLKTVITIIFATFSVFLYEQNFFKRKNK